MTCPHNVPYAIWRYSMFSDIFLAPMQCRTARQHQRRFLSAARTCCNPADSFDDTISSDRIEKPQNDTQSDDSKPNTRLSASLPQSPLVELAKHRPSGSKAYKNRGSKADQDRLKNNPWAVALASPVRYCSVTRMRMPAEFLTEMGLIRRVTASDEQESKPKKYGSLWWMPTDLVKDELKAAVHPNQGDSNAFVSKGKPRTIRLVNRALLYDRVREFFGGTGSNRLVKTKSLIPSIWRKDSPKSAHMDFSELVWRDDMAIFVFKQLIKKVVRGFQEVCRYEEIKKDTADMWRELPLPEMTLPALEKSLREVEMKDMETGGVIMLGHVGVSTEQNPRDAFKSAFNSTFPDYITIPQTSTMAPVFDLSVILTRSDLEALRQSHPRFNQRALFFRPDGPKSTEAMLALWKLKGYIMHDVDFFTATADDAAIAEDQDHGQEVREPLETVRGRGGN